MENLTPDGALSYVSINFILIMDADTTEFYQSRRELIDFSPNFV